MRNIVGMLERWGCAYTIRKCSKLCHTQERKKCCTTSLILIESNIHNLSLPRAENMEEMKKDPKYFPIMNSRTKKNEPIRIRTAFHIFCFSSKARQDNKQFNILKKKIYLHTQKCNSNFTSRFIGESARFAFEDFFFDKALSFWSNRIGVLRRRRGVVERKWINWTGNSEEKQHSTMEIVNDIQLERIICPGKSPLKIHISINAITMVYISNGASRI